MAGDIVPLDRATILMYFKNVDGDLVEVASNNPLPVVTAGGGGTPQVQVIAMAIQNPGTGSTTPLGASAEFVDGWQWGSFTQSRFTVAAGADQPGTLYLECSPDEGATVYEVDSAAIAANSWGQLTTIMVGWPMMYRARYVNGDTDQTKFVVARNLTFA